MGAGTVPFNFPPEATVDIGGEILTGSSLGNTAPLASTVFFTAPTTGLYFVAGLIHITQTDGAGTLTLTLTAPQLAPFTATGPVTSDVSIFPHLAFMRQGSQVTCSVSAAGLGATKFNVYMSATRTF